MLNRRIEFWGEGFRITDLKRTSSLNGKRRDILPCLSLSWYLAYQLAISYDLFSQDEFNANKAMEQNPL